MKDESQELMNDFGIRISTETLQLFEMKVRKFAEVHAKNVSKLTIFHNDLKHFIASLSSIFGLNAVEEYPLSYIARNNKERAGKIDVVFQKNSFKVAIEIDSTVKSNSIRKLVQSDANLRIWITYNKSENARIRLNELDEQHSIYWIDLERRYGLEIRDRNHPNHLDQGGPNI